MASYYEVLGCDKNASYEEIKKCYHDQVKKYHPDKSNEDSEEKFFILDKAWKTLRNADTRREYDLEMSRNDMSQMPLYCEIGLSEMDYEPEVDTYNYPCRCGGLYFINKSDIKEDSNHERLKVFCEECTYHIEIILNK